MAFVSLFSSPPSPVLDKNMTDCELAGEEREDCELEDGEINDEGISIEEEKEIKEESEEAEKDKKKGKEREKDDKSHRHSRKRHGKIKEKRRSRKRRRDRQKHHSPSSGSSSDSYDSEHERQDRPKSKKSKATYHDHDGEFAQRENEPAKPPRSMQYKNSEMDRYSDYSEEKYDYDEEDEDFSEELCKYKHAKESSGHGKTGPPKGQAKRPIMKGQQKQIHFGGQRGRGRGAAGRGRGLPNKKQKGKNWGWGRGRGGEQGGGDVESKGPPSFQKKRPIMSQEFINQHTVEHNGRHICKYFIEGRCIKGDQCKFEHDNVVPGKKKELCKFYVQGYCTKGDICIYMHNEYPCKFFHTGAKCYQGDNCKFSHEPLTDVTKELLDKILNTEEENVNVDVLELEDLRKHGIAPLPKPPPGVGLLPTPGPGSPPDGGKKIPSLFEIKVQPTVDLVQKIALRPNFYNSTSPTAGQFQGGGGPQFTGGPEDMQTGNMMSSPPNPSQPPPSGAIESPPLLFTGPGMLQSPPGQQPSQGFGQCPPMSPPGQPPGFHGNMQYMNRPPMNQQGAPFLPVPDMQMNIPFQNMGQMPSEFFKNLFSSQSLATGDEGHSGPMQDSQLQSNAESSGMQDFLPAVQKALLLHLNQNKQVSDTRREDGQGSAPPSREQDETPNWYSSDEEEGSSVTAILNTLKKKNDMLKNQQPSIEPAGHMDPRLQKERAVPNDPRIKAEPRHCPQDQRKDVRDSVGDPRFSRDPRKMKPMDPSSSKTDHKRHPNPSMSHKPPTRDEDEECERELRERAALIPLDPSPGAMLRDPRCQIKQFSHIRVDILLQRLAFAQTVVWGPEDLIPSLIPKQEPSINLPLPPLIADAQLNRSLSSPPDHPSSADLTPPDPRLAAMRLKEGIGRLGSPPGKTLDSRHHADKPMDPRTHKNLDPRVSRSGSLDSKLPGVRETPSGGSVLDPRLQRGCAGALNQPAAASAKPESNKLPPYAPRLAPSVGAGLESPTTLLGGISLYDPHNHTLLSPKCESEELPKFSSILKQSANLQSSPSPHASPSRGTKVEKEDKRPVDDSESNFTVCPSNSSVPTMMPASPCSPVRVAAPAVHNLPIQALARPAYADPRQNRPVGGNPQEQEEDKDNQKKDMPLRNVFKTFDPTASPFCQ
ncbi:zinc finger CCCH domain-containing protein 6-like [Xyrauchen texanus]|uniref:zinc finger CCCH domain-containing protein 6-like n=1 Tax=Xyrauchen texanus TaxID=154827 RepID=UPI002242007B|nr:zinc finger CCCH domain-containing protein 6-like [Xyrauchen texanus]